MFTENKGQSLVDRQIGPYKVLSLLGVGGMGEDATSGPCRPMEGSRSGSPTTSIWIGARSGRQTATSFIFPATEGAV